MREPKRDPGRLSDILEAADNVISFIDGIAYDSFVSDKLRYFAVLKNVEIVGEAAYMLSPQFKEKHNEIPWNRIIGMRHVLVHDYSTVLPQILWETAKNDIPILRNQVQQLYNIVLNDARI